MALLDDPAVAQRILDHIRDHTTDVGDDVWREPVENYRSPDRFEREIERVLRRSPTPFCPSAALPEPGSFVARDVAGVATLAVRGDDGRVRRMRLWRCTPSTRQPVCDQNASRDRNRPLSREPGATAASAISHSARFGLPASLLSSRSLGSRSSRRLSAATSDLRVVASTTESPADNKTSSNGGRIDLPDR